MRSRTLPFFLAPLLASLTALAPAFAEPPAVVAYVKRSTGECGSFRTGFREEERTPRDRGFGPIGLPWKPAECKQLLDQVLSYPEASRTPSRDLLGEAATKPPCERLALTLPVSTEHTCKALGYRYVGELPWSTRPCYPSLAPFLGARCAPLIWVHLALLIAVAACMGVLLYVIVRRQRQRRMALAAAASRATELDE